jgi:hypothetical protein
MSRALEDAEPRHLVALAVLVGGVLALALPPLLTTGVDPVSAAVVLVLGLAALLGLGAHQATLAALSGRVGLPSGDGPTLILAGRVTDPTHHPVRPRAPGTA